MIVKVKNNKCLGGSTYEEVSLDEIRAICLEEDQVFLVIDKDDEIETLPLIENFHQLVYLLIHDVRCDEARNTIKGSEE